MKKIWKGAGLCLAIATSVLVFGKEVSAADTDMIHSGIYVENVDLSGKTVGEAKKTMEQYVSGLGSAEITLHAANGHDVTVTAADLGIAWANPGVLEEAATFGTKGNVIQRYKELKDLEHEKKVYDLKLKFDVNAINQVLLEQCLQYDQNAVDAKVRRENGQFIVEDGQVGYALDVENSIDRVYDYLVNDWDYQPAGIDLAIEVEQPRGTTEDFAKVKDLLGTFTTSYSTSGTSRSANVENGCRLINATTLYPGDEFSTYKTVSPFSTQNGYYMAGSYLNGKVVDSIGGGICQVSTTLYNAVLLAELEVTERHNHSMIVSYVDPSADAAIAESAGKDFRFKNNTDYPIYIEGYTSGKKITFNVYGCETRSSGHSVKYESEVLEVIKPQSDAIYADGSHPIGYIHVESSHTGYKARLWKKVYENGVEVSKEQVNSSTYKMSPRSATVGTATADPNASAEIMAAIGTNSIDHVRNVIAILTAPPAPAEAQPAQ